MKSRVPAPETGRACALHLCWGHCCRVQPPRAPDAAHAPAAEALRARSPPPSPLPSLTTWGPRQVCWRRRYTPSTVSKNPGLAGYVTTDLSERQNVSGTGDSKGGKSSADRLCA